MPKDRIVELTLVVRFDRHMDADLEMIIRDALADEGLEVTELTRVGLTGTIDLPRVWLPSGDPYDASTDPRYKSEPPTQVTVPPRRGPPPPPPPEARTLRTSSWIPPWRKKR